jgi:hypothetical protein
MVASQPGRGAGVHEARQCLDQHRSAQVGHVVGELVEILRIRHSVLLSQVGSLITTPWWAASTCAGGHARDMGVPQAHVITCMHPTRLLPCRHDLLSRRG